MERPDWMVKAARKIDGLYYEWFLDKLTKKGFPEPDEQVPKIEAIIEEHYPSRFSDKWIAKSAAEIAAYEKKHFGTIAPGFPGPSERTEQQDIEAIILKYCPEDKAEKMAKALRETKAECYGATGDGLSSETCHLIDAALAEYEKTGATQVERVESPKEKMVEAFENVAREMNLIEGPSTPSRSEMTAFIRAWKHDLVAALAEYEKAGVTHIEHVETPKEKMAEKLADRLRHIEKIENREGQDDGTI